MGTARDAVRSALIIAEVALALTLLVGAGNLIRTAYELQQTKPGFDPSGLLMARVALPKASYSDPQRIAQIYDELAEAMSREPGVVSAAVTSAAPLGPGGWSNGLVPEGKALGIENSVDAYMRIVTPQIFATMRIPLVRGRLFTDRDRAGSERVMVISEALARKLWPGEDAIGKRVACCEGEPGDPRWKTVIGVVGDVRSRGPMADAYPEFYVPAGQAPVDAWEWGARAMSIVARGRSGDATSLTASMRRVVRAMDATLPLYSITTMDDALAASMAEARFHTKLLGALGAIGLVLAALGIYSVIAYFVSVRTHEIGVRMALGASPRNVVGLMTWQGMRPVLAGVAIGGVGALAATRLLASSLQGVSATDPVTFAVVVALMVGVGVLASLVPARRATRVDPLVALRE
jgi:predicted permease